MNEIKKNVSLSTPSVQNANSSYQEPCSSSNVNSENLAVDQDSFTELIIFFIPITCLLGSVLVS